MPAPTASPSCGCPGPTSGCCAAGRGRRAVRVQARGRARRPRGLDRRSAEPGARRRPVRRELGRPHLRLRPPGLERAARRAAGPDRGRSRSRARAFGETRDERVYLPAGHDPAAAYPLVVIHDGDDFVTYADLRGGARQPDRRPATSRRWSRRWCRPATAWANTPAAGATPATWCASCCRRSAPATRLSARPARPGAARRQPRRRRLARHRLPLSGRLRRAGAEVGLVHPRRAQAGAPAASGLPPHRPAGAGAAPRAGAARTPAPSSPPASSRGWRRRTGRSQPSCASAASMFCSRARGTATTGTTGATSCATGCAGCCGRGTKRQG